MRFVLLGLVTLLVAGCTVVPAYHHRYHPHYGYGGHYRASPYNGHWHR
jgi:hypothetical protein